MDEFAFIRTYMAPLAAGAPGAFGLGDDAASVGVAPGDDVVVTADAVVAGIHFRADDPPDEIARKALRVNISDLAAKGAAPLGFMMTLALPAGTSEAWLKSFAGGFAHDIGEFGIPLLGGDTTATAGPVVISITALGHVKTGTMIRRAGARPGDRLCVSGTIGDAALGLHADELPVPPQDRAFLAGRYRLPRPRLVLGRGLVGVASAAIDVSDGLIADVGHLCEQSHAAAVIELDRVPLSPPAQTLVAANTKYLDMVLGGGDDYELAFATSASDAELERLARDTGTGITVIGRFEPGSGARVLDGGGIGYCVSTKGYSHF